MQAGQRKPAAPRPSPALARARIAVFLLAPMAVIGLAGLALSWAADPAGMGALPLALSLGAIASLVVGALLARRGHVVAGVGIAVAGMEATIWALYALAGDSEATDQVLPYLAVPLLVAGLTMPPRWAIGTTIVTVALVPLLGILLAPGGVADELSSIGTLLALMGVIAVVASLIQERTQRALVYRASALEESSRALTEASAERLRLFQHIAHDLGAPLTPIKLQLAILGARIAEPSSRASLDMLQRSVNHLHSLVDQVKEIALIEGGAVRLAPKDIDLAESVRLARDELALASESRGVRLIVDAATPLPVRADPVRVTQVLYNLVGNALKFTPAGGEVRIEAAAEGSWARLAVRDTGPGMRQEQLGKLFKPFSQVHDPGLVSRTEDRGSGLGLFISKGLVEAHGGTIHASSEGPGRGSTFTFRLPLRDPA